jgi:hypothetical protein
VPKQRAVATRTRNRKPKNNRRVSVDDDQPLRTLDLAAVPFLLASLSDDVHAYESSGRWDKASRLVQKWRMRFEQLPAGEIREHCLEEWERLHLLLFHGEYIPFCVRTWARGRSIAELRVKRTFDDPELEFWDSETITPSF